MLFRHRITDEEIENGTWEENEERQEPLSVCDKLYFERPEYIESMGVLRENIMDEWRDVKGLPKVAAVLTLYFPGL